MADSLQKCLEKSAAEIDVALPIIRKFLNDDSIELIRIEDIKNSVMKALDRYAGIDYILHSTKTDRVYSMAWRCQWVYRGYEYDSFSIRYKKANGAKTEFQKRREGLEYNSMCPYYSVHAFFDKITKELISIAITTVKDEFDFFDSPYTNVQLKETGDGQDGKAWFYFLNWNDMQLLGYNVKVYKNGKYIT